MKDGKERSRRDIIVAVKSKMGKEFNEGTLAQAMSKLSKENFIMPVKGKRGTWIHTK